MKTLLFIAVWLMGVNSLLARIPETGVASWYGETHRGRFMANGKRFDPSRLTAASWFYPLGTKVRVTLNNANKPSRTVLVTVTDRGPAKDLVQNGRIIDLTYAAFRRLADTESGLINVRVEKIR
jgi:rare lipoprotein A